MLKETHDKMCQLHENKSLKPEDAREKERNILDATDKKLIEIKGKEKFKSWKEKQEYLTNLNIKVNSKLVKPLIARI